MLELSHIQKSFDGVSVLKDISIQVEDGEIVSILGPSGCGKTTLLNIILGIVEADAGTIVYNGEDLTRTVMEKRGFNIVFQDYALFPNLNVYQNITYGLKNKPGISSQEGAIIVNTEMLAENNLPMPTCLKDLADPAYAGFVAVTDVQSSSTAWLLMQALVSEYGEEEAQNILHDIYVNAGDHVESSGSAPLQLCEAGEVAVGFGLRHQTVAAKNDGLPIDYVDPTEGNFSLTESVAVLDKGDATNPLAMEMAQCIIENGRAELQQNYPNPLYEGESADNANKSAYPKTFSEPLTFELYEHHIEISEAAKP